MSTEITALPAAEPQRRGLMAALEVAAHILSIAPIPPSSVAPECMPYASNAPRVEVYFYGPTGVDGVEQLAEALDERATTVPHADDNPAPYTSVDAMVNGIPVHAWTLGEAPQPESDTAGELQSPVPVAATETTDPWHRAVDGLNALVDAGIPFGIAPDGVIENPTGDRDEVIEWDRENGRWLLTYEGCDRR